MIKRLGLYLLAALGSFALCGVAYAAPAIYWVAQVNGLQGRGFSPEQSCMTLYTKTTGYTYAGIKDLSATDARCMATSVANPSAPASQVGYTEKKTCPTTEPYWDSQKNMCVAYEPPPDNPCSDKNEFIRRWNYPAGGTQSPPGHYGGCVISVVKMLVCRKEPTGMTYCMWLVKRTGEKYDGPPDGSGGSGSDSPEKPQDPPTVSPPIKAPPAPPGSNPCPTGTVQAGTAIDGTPMCMGMGSNPQNSPPPPPKIESSQTTPTPDGGTKTTDTTTTQNSDGSSTTVTKTTTTAPDGTKTITVTKDTSAARTGEPGKDESNREDDKYDLCKQNPMLMICRNSSVSGTCGEIACEGDAIQCATLRAAAAMQCQQQKDLEDLTARPEVAAGNAILSGADPMKGAIDTALKGTEVDMSQPNLDDSGFVSSRACLAPRTFAVAGKSITVDFGELCDSIEALRYAVLACAWIAAYLIVSRSVLNS